MSKLNLMSALHGLLGLGVAAAAASQKPSVQKLGQSLALAKADLEAAFPDLAEDIFNAGVVAVGTAEPILQPFEGVIEGIGDPIVGGFASAVKGFFFGSGSGSTAAAAPQPSAPAPEGQVDPQQ
jgi:hypothetical protein